MSTKKEKNIWYGMLNRCYNPNNDHYKYYGKRGITVCEAWRNSFLEFYADMGPSKSDLSIERKDNDGNYEPSNCKWATRFEQEKTKRKSSWGKKLTFIPSLPTLRQAKRDKELSDYFASKFISKAI